MCFQRKKIKTANSDLERGSYSHPVVSSHHYGGEIFTETLVTSLAYWSHNSRPATT